jgi:hypothetical protein
MKQLTLDLVAAGTYTELGLSAWCALGLHRSTMSEKGCHNGACRGSHLISCHEKLPHCEPAQALRVGASAASLALRAMQRCEPVDITSKLLCKWYKATAEKRPADRNRSDMLVSGAAGTPPRAGPPPGPSGGESGAPAPQYGDSGAQSGCRLSRASYGVPRVLLVPEPPGASHSHRLFVLLPQRTR